MSERLAGRELDAAIAERIFGWQWWAFRRLDNLERESYILPPRNMLTGHTNTYIATAGCVSDKEQSRAYLWFAYGGQVVERENLPEFSKHMGDAWQVAEWIVAQGYHIEMSVDKESANVEIWEDDAEFPSYWTIVVDVDAPLTQEAICYAALELKKRLEVNK